MRRESIIIDYIAYEFSGIETDIAGTPLYFGEGVEEHRRRPGPAHPIEVGMVSDSLGVVVQRDCRLNTSGDAREAARHDLVIVDLRAAVGKVSNAIANAVSCSSSSSWTRCTVPKSESGASPAASSES